MTPLIRLALLACALLWAAPPAPATAQRGTGSDVEDAEDEDAEDEDAEDE